MQSSMMYSYPCKCTNSLVAESGSSLRDNLFAPTYNSKNNRESRYQENRQVTFFGMVAIRETIHLNEFTAEEYQRSWYNRRELRDIKHRQKRTAASIQDGKLKIDTDVDCKRGLECRVGEKAHQRRRRISYALTIVLSEQQDQRMLGILDPVTISLAYRLISRVSAAQAYDFGLRDEVEAYYEKYSSTRANKERKSRSKRIC